ncbi:MAG: PD40 domain-containing protein [Gemmatimonadetes bacterium]|nr:PD40 domain-containing protein [Gemmatimonadota bacterium]
MNRPLVVTVLRRISLPLLFLALGCQLPHGRGVALESHDAAALAPAGAPARAYPASAEEPRLANLRMLTDGGENAEAYFSADGRRLIFQATRPGESRCDQIYTMEANGSSLRRVSTGLGRTTCGFFFPSGERILYSSTHEAGRECPPPPDYSRGYVWALYDYDMYTAHPDGGDLRRLTRTPGYDAEGTISPDGRTIVFTSVRDGDLEIYTMDARGRNVRRLTHEPGYDGGAVFSPDGNQIVYRAHHPTGAELADYRALLERGLVRPVVLELFIMNADGSNKRQLTRSGAASFAPAFHPNGRQIVFSSNLHDPKSRNFDLYLIDVDGAGLERVTTHPDFDGFPMFSPDGRRLVFASNRGARVRGETNIFVGDWIEQVATSWQ